MYFWTSVKSPDDFASLANEISPEFDPQGVIKKLKAGISSAVKGVLIERNYIDKDYRSTFYNFYAKKGQTYRTDCIRLHFFDETVGFEPKALRLTCKDPYLKDHYFGYIVLRPTGIATIGRTVLSPDIRTGTTGFVITGEHKVHLLGYKLLVQGFPSMDQHIDISVCSHAACWSILRHYSERYSIYREFLTHDITLMAQQFNPGGLVPSKGLEVSHAERVFQQAGTFPVHVARVTATDVSFYRQMHAYVESGFPLFAAMQARNHAVAVIGYEWRAPLKDPLTAMRSAWDEVKSLVVVDDHFLPYQSIPVDGKTTTYTYTAKAMDAFIVALPEKIYYPADAIDLMAPTLFKLGALLNLPPKEKTILRYFITTGSALRRFMRERESEFDPKLLQTVMSLPMAQFVWIVEFATGEDWAKRQISARAVLDATASLRETNPLWLFHSRTNALIYNRRRIGTNDVRTLGLSGMDKTALTRWDQNLRPIQGKA